MSRIAIVGGGAAGAWAALFLAHHGRRDIEVAVFEPRPEIGRGLAYSSEADSHRLNVPAWKMDIGLDLPVSAFVEWLADQFGVADPKADPHGYSARHLYGRYLSEMVDRDVFGPAGCGRFRRHRRAIVRLERADGGRLAAWSSEGFEGHFDDVLLATGNMPARRFPWLGPELDGHPAIHADPWSPLGHVPRQRPALIVGAALTSLDVVLSLRESGHADTVTLVSRTGLLPLPDDPGTADLEWPVPDPPHTPVGILRLLRRRARDAAAAGEPWQSVVDSFRTTAGAHWRAFDAAGRGRIVRHALTHWSIHRHRAAPDVVGAVQSLRRMGVVDVVAGRIEAVVPSGGELDVTVRRRRTGERLALRVATLVNCAGPDGRPSTADSPLMRSLVADGLVRDHPTGLGMDAAPDGRVVGRDGTLVSGLHVIGPALRGLDFEALAVPAIRLKIPEAALFRRHCAALEQAG